MVNFQYPKPVQKYCVFIKFIFLLKTCSDLNFNQKFDYDFGTQVPILNYSKFCDINLD